MGTRSIIFLAATHHSPRRVLPREQTADPTTEVPRCLVQIGAERCWDGEGEWLSEFDVLAARLSARTAAERTRRLQTYADDLQARGRPLLVTIGGQRTVASLRWAYIMSGVVCPLYVSTSDRSGTFPVRSERQFHFDVAEYLGLRPRGSAAVVASVLHGCGLPAQLAAATRTPTLSGALLCAVATCLLYLRIAQGAGLMQRQARARAAEAIATLLFQRAANHQTARDLLEALAEEASPWRLKRDSAKTPGPVASRRGEDPYGAHQE